LNEDDEIWCIFQDLQKKLKEIKENKKWKKTKKFDIPAMLR
jgi:hypothetical protein